MHRIHHRTTGEDGHRAADGAGNDASHAAILRNDSGKCAMRTEYYTVCKPVQTEAPACGCNPCCGTCTKMVEEKRQCVIEYTVCVPQMKTRTVNITTCKYVPEQCTVMCSICVPHTVEKQVDVCVYHMVEKKILCPAPTCCNYGCGCGYGGCGWRAAGERIGDESRRQ